MRLPKQKNVMPQQKDIFRIYKKEMLTRIEVEFLYSVGVLAHWVWRTPYEKLTFTPKVFQKKASKEFRQQALLS